MEAAISPIGGHGHKGSNATSDIGQRSKRRRALIQVDAYETELGVGAL